MSGEHQSKLLQQVARQKAGGVSADTEDEGDTYRAEDYDPPDYKPYTMARRPPGFSLVTKDRSRFFIFYHQLGNLKFSVGKSGAEFIQLTHQGLGATIRGKQLLKLFNLISEGRLKAVFEPASGAAVTGDTIEPLIHLILVYDVMRREPDAEEDDGPRLVKR